MTPKDINYVWTGMTIIEQEDVQQFAKNLDLQEVLTFQRFTIQVFRELWVQKSTDLSKVYESSVQKTLSS